MSRSDSGVLADSVVTDVARVGTRSRDEITFVGPGPMSRFGVRVFDLAVGTTAAVLLAPVWLTIAAILGLSRSGPIMYSQVRVGQNGRPFHCFKFRSMVADADAVLEELLARDADAALEWEQVQKLTNDPRTTRIGRVLRRFDLDEIPQLLNVIKGDMSIVGPRPILPDECWRYGPAHEIVVLVKPGMTGEWQTSGRNGIPYLERVNIDVRYALNRSLRTDLGICFRTMRVVLARDGR